MKTTLAQDRQPRTSHSSRKHRASFDQHKLREYSKEGHVNPLKVKTSFLRNSVNLNSNENLLSLNFPSSTHNSRKDSPGQQSFLFQSDRKEDFKSKKLQENLFDKDFKSIDFADSIKQNSFNSHSRKFSERLSDYNFSTDLQQRNVMDEKQNKFLLGLSASVGNDSVSSAKNQIKSFAEKHQKSRFSQLNAQQPVFYDSSLADYANRLGLTSSKQESSLSIVKDQIQLILKRLAKNECDIETLKRDKNIDLHMERVWKEISNHENRFDIVQKSASHTRQKLTVWQKEIEKIRTQMSKIQQDKSYVKSEIKELENRIQLDLKDITNVKEYKTEQINLQVQTRLRREFENLFKRLESELKENLESKFVEFKMRLNGEDRIEQILRAGKFRISHKKAHNWISLVYKEVLKVKKSSSISQQQQQSSQNSFNTNQSDRSKLLSKAFTQQHQRRQSTNWQYQQPTQQRQQLTKQQSTQSTDIQTNESNLISHTQVEYFIDENGYLLDSDKYYILDGDDNMIKIDDKMSEKLVSQGIIMKSC